MSSVLKGLRCLVEAPVAVRVDNPPPLDHEEEWKVLVGEADRPRLVETRLERSVVDGSISTFEDMSTVEFILGDSHLKKKATL